MRAASLLPFNPVSTLYSMLRRPHVGRRGSLPSKGNALAGCSKMPIEMCRTTVGLLLEID